MNLKEISEKSQELIDQLIPIVLLGIVIAGFLGIIFIICSFFTTL